MKRYLVAAILLSVPALAQDAAPAPQPQPPDSSRVATEIMLNEMVAARRDALAKAVELDRMVTDLRAQVATLQAQLTVFRAKPPPSGDTPK